MPEPLLTQFVLPTLKEWARQKPQSAIPVRWLGVLTTNKGYAGMRCGFYAADLQGLNMLQEALRLDPLDQIARVRLLECRIGLLDLHAHHLPKAYLGEPEADFRAIEDAEALTTDLIDPLQKVRLLGELRSVRQLLKDWTDSLAANVDFGEWRSRPGRPLTNVSRVYVYDPQKTSE